MFFMRKYNVIICRKILSIYAFKDNYLKISNIFQTTIEFLPTSVKTPGIRVGKHFVSG